jgi:hypothetical protein
MTIMGERATRSIRVCGPGAFVVLKALAFDHRGESVGPRRVAAFKTGGRDDVIQADVVGYVPALLWETGGQ